MQGMQIFTVHWSQLKGGQFKCSVPPVKMHKHYKQRVVRVANATIHTPLSDPLLEG